MMDERDGHINPEVPNHQDVAGLPDFLKARSFSEQQEFEEQWSAASQPGPAPSVARSPLTPDSGIGSFTLDDAQASGNQEPIELNQDKAGISFSTTRSTSTLRRSAAICKPISARAVKRPRLSVSPGLPIGGGLIRGMSSPDMMAPISPVGTSSYAGGFSGALVPIVKNTVGAAAISGMSKRDRGLEMSLKELDLSSGKMEESIGIKSKSQWYENLYDRKLALPGTMQNPTELKIIDQLRNLFQEKPTGPKGPEDAETVRRVSQFGHRCKLCGKSFVGFRNYLKHQTSEHTAENKKLVQNLVYHCFFESCEGMQFSLADLLMHIKEGHLSMQRGPSEEQDIYLCPCCNPSLTSFSAMKVAQHVMRMYGAYSCEVCGRKHVSNFASAKCKLAAAKKLDVHEPGKK